MRELAGRTWRAWLASTGRRWGHEARRGSKTPLTGRPEVVNRRERHGRLRRQSITDLPCQTPRRRRLWPTLVVNLPGLADNGQDCPRTSPLVLVRRRGAIN